MKVTNLSKANEIVKTMLAEQATKQLILDQIVKDLGVTRANAYVYFSKCLKAQGVQKVEKEQTPKAVKASKPKVNPVTETSPDKIQARVKEIDTMIQNLKQASPFQGLGI